MNLLRLLAVGKSLIGIKQERGYRVSAEARLPKFEAGPKAWSTSALPARRDGPGSSAGTDFYPQAEFKPKAGSGQGELPLLKVVRNDLSDADLEVRAQKGTVPAGEKKKAGAVQVKGSVLEKVG
jgi:hypothetical protein